jgi:hypothetical protein
MGAIQSTQDVDRSKRQPNADAGPDFTAGLSQSNIYPHEMKSTIQEQGEFEELDHQPLVHPQTRRSAMDGSGSPVIATKLGQWAYDTGVMQALDEYMV